VHRIGRTGRAGASGDAISIFSDKDERLLADIEKLIKQTIKRGELEGFAPSSSRAERDDRHGERRHGSRRPEGEGRSAAPGAAPAYGAGNGSRPERSRSGPSASSGYGGAPRREKIDPWFLKPYEPAKSSAPAPAPLAQPAKPKQKVAALLGGLRKP
jgi:superfamily II DNA/RNA helicase